jgi:hypothetical protein
MRGHEPIIAMRKAGTTPKTVFINDYPCHTSLDWHDPGQAYGEGWPADDATVSTAGDAISSLDLRFLVGLTVSISSHSEGRAKALFEACKQAGAKTVAACHVQPTHPHLQAGWAEVFQKPEINHA